MSIDLEKEREAFEKSLAKKGIELRFIHIVFDDGVYRFSDNFNDQSDFHKDALHEIECGWEAWQQRADIAKSEINDLKQQISELHASRESLLEYKNKIESGDFVLVSRDKIKVIWQDDDELENFYCPSSGDDLNYFGDGIDLNEIMTISAHHQANLKAEKMYGTWFAEVGHPKEKANFHVGTHQECLDIVAKNKAMIEASK